MQVSLWELLTFTPEELRIREQEMTWQEREAERLELARAQKEKTDEQPPKQ